MEGERRRDPCTLCVFSFVCGGSIVVSWLQWPISRYVSAEVDDFEAFLGDLAVSCVQAFVAPVGR